MSTIRELLANAGFLTVGKVTAAAFGLLSTLLAARGLGVEQFGILAMIVAYSGLIDKVVGFQPWQSVIRYGSILRGAGENKTFGSLVKLGFILDGAGATLAAMVAAAAAYIAGALLAWSPEVTSLAMLYGLTLLTNTIGTPLGVLRIENKYRLLMSQSIITAGIKLAGAAVVWLAGGGLAAFIGVWAVSDIIGRTLLVGMCLSVLRHRGDTRWISADVSIALQRFNDFWAFTWSAKLQTTVRAGTTDMDTLIVGAVLGSAAAGLFAIVKKFGAIVITLSDPLYQAIYPILARLWSNGEYRQFWSLMRHTVVVAGLVALLVWFAFLGIGNELIEIMLGNAYLMAFGPMAIYLFGSLIAVASFAAYPALLAIGEAPQSLAILTISTMLYLVLLVIFSAAFGMHGATFAFVFFYLTWSALVYRRLRAVKRRGVLGGSIEEFSQ